MSLRQVDAAEPGYRRRRAGRGFVYLDCDGRRITDEDEVARIRALAIPPAWMDVWICPDARGHIQARGVDARGRRQYRYHDEWRIARDRAKHDRMLELARALPRLRHRLRRDLAAEGLGRDRVLACAVRLLELGLFRVGGEEYADDNGSHGLATVHKRHVRLEGDEMRFDFTGKGGRRRVVVIRDAPVAEVVGALARRRGGGPELLAYKSERGRWVDVRSSDINGYLQDALGPHFSAKDFRTWMATVLAAVGLAAEDDADSERQRQAAVRRVVRSVARQLGNTPAVARGSYVDPRVIERYEEGDTVGDALADGAVETVAEPVGAHGEGEGGEEHGVPVEGMPPSLLSEIEAAVVDLVDRSPRPRGRRRAGGPRGRRRPGRRRATEGVT